MTTNQKMDFLCNLDETSAFYDNNVKIIRQCCVDSNSGVRSFAASALVYFTDETAKDLLLRLAKDRNAMVRTESYDSLAVFPFEEVQSFLYHAIQTEVDNLARNYAILSFADVTVELKAVTPDRITWLEQKRKLEKNAHCSLAYCYALYVFGKTEVLDEWLEFLKHDDYHIRCGTISLLDYIDDITNNNNDVYMKEHISKLLETEEVYAVISSAETFLEEHELIEKGEFYRETHFGKCEKEQ